MLRTDGEVTARLRRSFYPVSPDSDGGFDDGNRAFGMGAQNVGVTLVSAREEEMQQGLMWRAAGKQDIIFDTGCTRLKHWGCRGGWGRTRRIQLHVVS